MAKEREFHSFGAAYVNQRSPSVTSDNFLGHSVKLIFSVGEKRMFDWDQMFQSKLLSTVLNSENNLPLPYIGPKSHGEWVGPVVMYLQWLAACFSCHGFKDSVFLTRSQIKKNIKVLLWRKYIFSNLSRNQNYITQIVVVRNLKSKFQREVR